MTFTGKLCRCKHNNHKKNAKHFVDKSLTVKIFTPKERDKRHQNYIQDARFLRGKDIELYQQNHILQLDGLAIHQNYIYYPPTRQKETDQMPNPDNKEIASGRQCRIVNHNYNNIKHPNVLQEN